MHCVNKAVFGADVETLDSQSFDAVIECSGNPEGLELAVSFVKPEGTIVLKSTYQKTAAIDLSQLVVREVKILGSRCGNMAAALQLLASQKLNLDYLIEKRFALEEGIQALHYASQEALFKVIIECDS